MFSYRFFIKQAWQLTRGYRHLWFFGLFASFLAIGGEYQIILQGLKTAPGGNFVSSGFFMIYTLFNPTFYAGFKTVALNNPSSFWALISVLVLLLALLALFLYLAITSEAALIKQGGSIMSGKKKKENIDIAQGLKDGRRYFWKVLGLNIVDRLVVSASFLIISIPLLFLFFTDTRALALAYTILFIIFVPVALSLSFIIKYAVVAGVFDKKRFVPAIEKGIEIFKNNWLVSLEMALLLFLINFLVGIAVLIVISLFFLPLFFVAVQMSSVLLISLSFLLSLAVMLVAASILNTFQISAWTSLYLHLREQKGHSKLERLFGRSR